MKRRSRPRRFWFRWQDAMFFPKLPEDAEHTTVLLVETSAPLRFPNSYSTSCELQGRRSVRYYGKIKVSRIFQRFHWSRTEDNTYSLSDATRCGTWKYFCEWVASGRRQVPFIAILKKMMRKDEKREKQRNARDADAKATERETRGGLTTRERESVLRSVFVFKRVALR